MPTNRHIFISQPCDTLAYILDIFTCHSHYYVSVFSLF